MNSQIWDLVIIGGGPAGLCAALHLSKNNCKVALIEKHAFPHHKVCGEYVSNEVLPYLLSLGIDPTAEGAKKIDRFELSNPEGQLLEIHLPLGGFGMSRFAFDALLFKNIGKNITVIFNTVETVSFENNFFKLKTKEKKSIEAAYVLGAFGKRSNIDIFLKRAFIKKPSPWLAVKTHYHYDFAEDTVALHQFEGGYCGLSKTETSVVNACYLTTLNAFQRCGNIDDLQKKVLSQNPFLKEFFLKAEPIFEKPLSIGQISFEKKMPVENHVFMAGDSAGLIHPLCGNGIAMAVHAAKIFSELFLKFGKNGTKEFNITNIHREKLEKQYAREWQWFFSGRLRTGRMLQGILQNRLAAKAGFSVAKALPWVLPFIIKKTHGLPLS